MLDCRVALERLAHDAEFLATTPEQEAEGREADTFLRDNYAECRQILVSALEESEMYAYAAAITIAEAKDPTLIPELARAADRHQGEPAGLAAVNAIGAAGTNEARKTLARIMRQMRHPNSFRAAERLLPLDEELALRTLREAVPSLLRLEARERRALARKIARALRKQSNEESHALAVELEAVAEASDG